MFMVAILVVLVITKNSKHYNKIVLSCMVAQSLRYNLRLCDMEKSKESAEGTSSMNDMITMDYSTWLYLTNILSCLTMSNLFIIHNNFKFTKFKTFAEILILFTYAIGLLFSGESKDNQITWTYVIIFFLGAFFIFINVFVYFKIFDRVANDFFRELI